MAKRKSTSKSEVNAAPMIDRDWRARDDAETLRRAGEIMGDRGRVKAAQSELRKSMAAIERVASRTPSLGLTKKGR